MPLDLEHQSSGFKNIPLNCIQLF